MSQSLANVLIHLVYSTKHRKPFLRDPNTREELNKYLTSCYKSLESPVIIVNGTEDHIHSLFSLSRNYAIKTIVQKLKVDSSKWIKARDRSFRDFAWQRGYGAFSVSESNKEAVRRYIMNQEHHHKRMTYQVAFRKICAQHGVALDERYAWD